MTGLLVFSFRQPSPSPVITYIAPHLPPTVELPKAQSLSAPIESPSSAPLAMPPATLPSQSLPENEPPHIVPAKPSTVIRPYQDPEIKKSLDEIVGTPPHQDTYGGYIDATWLTNVGKEPLKVFVYVDKDVWETRLLKPGSKSFITARHILRVAYEVPEGYKKAPIRVTHQRTPYYEQNLKAATWINKIRRVDENSISVDSKLPTSG